MTATALVFLFLGYISWLIYEAMRAPTINDENHAEDKEKKDE